MSEFNAKYELVGIVRKITSNLSLKTNSSDKKAVIVDESSGKIVNRTRPFKKYRKYLIYSDQILKGEIKNIEIEDFDTLNVLKLRVTYKAQCPYENIDKLVERLFAGNGEYPQNRLHGLIEKYIEEYVEKFESTSEFFQKFYDYKRSLIKVIKKRVEREIGLKLDANISLKYEDELETIELEDGFFEIYVNDYDRGLQFKYKAQLDVDPEQKINAIIKFEQNNELKGEVKKRIKKILLKEVTLDDFISNFDLVKDKLLKYLNQSLIKNGRTLSYLSIQNENLVTDSEKEFILDDYIVNCKLKDSSIEITHNLIMRLTNLGKFKNEGIKDIKVWVKNKLNSITKKVLFGKTYLDIILNFDKQNAQDEDNEIKKEMVDAAKLIGYEVQQLITIPKVKPLELVDGFSFDVGELEEFSTLNTRIRIKLIVAVSGRISDLKEIERYISPNIDIIEKMKERVKLSIKQVIDKVEPERYYIRFKDFDENQEKQSIEAELISVISEKLKDEFHASEIIITPKQLDTEITIRFAELISQFFRFEFETFPFREGGSGERVKFDITYQVKNVHPDGWHQFQSKKFNSIEEEVEQISNLLKVRLKNTLSTIKSGEITFKTFQDVDKLIKIANLRLQPVILQAFGLEINILSIEREATKLESTFYDRREKVLEIDKERAELEKDASIAITKNRLGELNLLMERKTQLESIPEYADSEELKDVRKRIEEFPTEFNDIHIGDGLVDIDIDEEVNDLDSLLSFLGGNHNKQIGEGSDSKKLEENQIQADVDYSDYEEE